MRRPGLALKLSVLLVLGVVGTMLADFVLAPTVDGDETRARVLLFVCIALVMALVAALVLDVLVIRPLGLLAGHARRLEETDDRVVHRETGSRHRHKPGGSPSA